MIQNKSPGAVDALFNAFVGECIAVVESRTTELEIAHSVAELTRRLLEETWCIADGRYARLQRNRPYGSYLLYLHPDERLCIVQDVFSPGQTTGVHNHGIWGAVGVVQGKERERVFDADPQSGKSPHEINDRLYGVGDVAIILPKQADFHSIECAGNDASISLHIYGANIGTRERIMWHSAAGSFVRFRSGYSNADEGLPIYLSHDRA